MKFFELFDDQMILKNSWNTAYVTYDATAIICDVWKTLYYCNRYRYALISCPSFQVHHHMPP